MRHPQLLLPNHVARLRCGLEMASRTRLDLVYVIMDKRTTVFKATHHNLLGHQWQVQHSGKQATVDKVSRNLVLLARPILLQRRNLVLLAPRPILLLRRNLRHNLVLLARPIRPLPHKCKVARNLVRLALTHLDKAPMVQLDKAPMVQLVQLALTLLPSLPLVPQMELLRLLLPLRPHLTPRLHLTLWDLLRHLLRHLLQDRFQCQQSHQQVLH
jgi:hypothetical protein